MPLGDSYPFGWTLLSKFESRDTGLGLNRLLTAFEIELSYPGLS